jgi:hypothetical protein
MLDVILWRQLHQKLKDEKPPLQYPQGAGCPAPVARTGTMGAAGLLRLVPVVVELQCQTGADGQHVALAVALVASAVVVDRVQTQPHSSSSKASPTNQQMQA